MPAEDPCAVLAELEAAKRKIITGGQATRVAFRSGDLERDVRFGQANLTELNAEIRKYDSLCRAQRGELPRRNMVRGG